MGFLLHSLCVSVSFLLTVLCLSSSPSHSPCISLFLPPPLSLLSLLELMIKPFWEVIFPGLSVVVPGREMHLLSLNFLRPFFFCPSSLVPCIVSTILSLFFFHLSHFFIHYIIHLSMKIMSGGKVENAKCSISKKSAF